MENTDQTSPSNETPTAKKKWETPQLTLISSGTIAGGNAKSYHEASFVKTSRYYNNFKGTGIGESVYNNVSS
jgi:hypothetical protein